MVTETIEVLRIPGTLFPRGPYDETATYKFLNFVESGGSGYVCLQPCTGIPVTNTAYWFKFVFKGEKGDAFTYADLTDAQKAELVQDATAAAQAAAASSLQAAASAEAANQKFATIKAIIDAIDPTSTEGSIQTLAAKQGLLEAGLDELGLKTGQILDALCETTTEYQEIKTTDADGSASGKYVTSAGKYSSSTNYTIWYKLISEETKIAYSVSESSGSISYSSVVPSGGVTVDNLIQYGEGSGTAIIPAGNYLWWCAKSATPSNATVNKKIEVQGEIKEIVSTEDMQSYVQGFVQDKIDILPLVYSNHRDRRMVADEVTPMIIDTMQAVHGKCGMTSVAQLEVVSSTESALTLSAADAAYFTDPNPAVVGYEDGSYKIVFLQAADGTTVAREDYETTSLEDAETVQALHDTIKGGGGIHLSQMGFLALAQFTAAELAKVQIRKDELLAGVSFAVATQTDNVFTDENGNKVGFLDNHMVMSGAVTNGGLRSCGINSSASTDFTLSNGWLTKCFRWLQNDKDAYAEIVLPAYGKGFVEVQGAMLNSNGYRTGTATLALYADGVQVGSSQQMVFTQTRYYFSNVTANGELRLRITIDSNNDTMGCIYSFNFWRCPSTITAPSLSGKRIAFLGASWTQFPHVNDGLADHSDYNSKVIRPNGSDGDGYGYFPKEFARVTGAIVDNWGKSGMTTANWGLPMIDEVLEYADYDYIIIVFFFNDNNSDVSTKDWLHNIRKIATKAMAKGVRPIIMTPCLTNGTGFPRDYWLHIYRGWLEG